MPLDKGVLDFAREARRDGPTVDEDILEISRRIQGEQTPVQQPAREYEDEFRAKQDEERLKWARGQLEVSPLPSFKAFGVAAGAPIVAGIARLTGQGEYADRMIRGAAAIEQAATPYSKAASASTAIRSVQNACRFFKTSCQSSVVGRPFSLTPSLPHSLLPFPLAPESAGRSLADGS